MLDKSDSVGIKPIAISSSEDYLIFRETVYRFRIANADFLKTYHHLKFIGTNAKNESVELEFFIIGSDSSLRSVTLGPITSLNTILPAERFDLLIKFGK